MHMEGIPREWRLQVAGNEQVARWMTSASLSGSLSMGLTEVGLFFEIFPPTFCDLHFATRGFCAEGRVRHDSAEFMLPTIAEACITSLSNEFMV
jgi:hypothetical protein